MSATANPYYWWNHYVPTKTVSELMNLNVSCPTFHSLFAAILNYSSIFRTQRTLSFLHPSAFAQSLCTESPSRLRSARSYTPIIHCSYQERKSKRKEHGNHPWVSFPYFEILRAIVS
jgi:hypothetical protein